MSKPPLDEDDFDYETVPRVIGRVIGQEDNGSGSVDSSSYHVDSSGISDSRTPGGAHGQESPAPSKSSTLSTAERTRLPPGQSGSESDDASFDTSQTPSAEDSASGSVVEVVTKVSLDDLCTLPSLGSSGHAAFKCRPCVFAPTCPRGATCRCCHFPEHGEGYTSKTKMRPCKGKREQYKSLIRRTFNAIDSNPETFNPEELKMPWSVHMNPRAKQKFLARTQKHLQEHRGSEAVSQRPGESKETTLHDSSSSLAPGRLKSNISL
jgi:hypothetical protein